MNTTHQFHRHTTCKITNVQISAAEQKKPDGPLDQYALSAIGAKFHFQNIEVILHTHYVSFRNINCLNGA